MSTLQRLQRAGAALFPKRWTRLTWFGPRPLGRLPADSEQLISEWVEWAHRHTIVEPNGEPAGFVVHCPPAPGAFTFADTEQQAADEMRDCLFGWAEVALRDGQELPALPAEPAR